MNIPDNTQTFKSHELKPVAPVTFKRPSPDGSLEDRSEVAGARHPGLSVPGQAALLWPAPGLGRELALETVRELHPEQGEASPGPEQSSASEADAETEDEVLECSETEAGLCGASA